MHFPLRFVETKVNFGLEKSLRHPPVNLAGMHHQQWSFKFRALSENFVPFLPIQNGSFLPF